VRFVFWNRHVALRAVIFLLLAVFSYASAQAPTLRVLLAKGEGFTVGLLGPHDVWTLEGKRFSNQDGATYRVRLGRDGVLVDGRALGPLVSFVPKGGFFTLNGRRYPGFLRILQEAKTLYAVNVVGLADYLAGVLPGEMPASFPLEALKAQAVLARTYAMRALGRGAIYDLCATTACQVYLGLAKVQPSYRAAIQSTAGMVLAYRGGLVRAVYHADSGGKTASALEVWGQAFPYLVVRDDPYTPGRWWQKTLDPERVAGALARLGLRVGRVASMRVTGRTASGRVGTLVVKGSQGEVRLRAPQVTGFLRGLGLPSTLAWVEGGLRFKGRGTGHGVGMSQWGAKGLAERGWNYREILGYYYPGTVLAPYVLEAGP